MNHHNTNNKKVLEQIDIINKNNIRCGFCFNEMVHSKKPHIIEIDDLQLDDNTPCYAVLCDDCSKAKREPKNIILFLGSDDNMPKNTIYYVDINDRIILEPKSQNKIIKEDEQEQTKEEIEEELKSQGFKKI